MISACLFATPSFSLLHVFLFLSAWWRRPRPCCRERKWFPASCRRKRAQGLGWFAAWGAGGVVWAGVDASWASRGFPWREFASGLGLGTRRVGFASLLSSHQGEGVGTVTVCFWACKMARVRFGLADGVSPSMRPTPDRGHCWGFHQSKTGTWQVGGRSVKGALQSGIRGPKPARTRPGPLPLLCCLHHSPPSTL